MPVTFVTHKRFPVLFFLPSCCVNSLMDTNWGPLSVTTRTTPKRWIFVLWVFIAIIPIYFVKCTLTLLNLNSREPYSSLESEIKFRRCLFTFSLNYEIRHFHVVVVQKRQRNVQKSVPHVQSCCFSYLSYFFRRSLCRRVAESLSL